MLIRKPFWLKYLWKMRCKASSSKAAIVLFDPKSEEYLKEMVLQDLEYIVFDPKHDTVYSTGTVFRSLIKCIIRDRKLFFRSIKSRRNLKMLLRRVRAQLIADQLRKMEPRVVITWIDNSNLFHRICEVYEEVPFIAIQNGGRHIWCATEAVPDPDLKYHIDEYYCFGQYVEDLFQRHRHNIERYVHSGSLLAGYFYGSYLNSSLREDLEYDVCLVSQWDKTLLNFDMLPQRFVRLEGAINILTEFVARYVSEKRVSVCIPLRTDDHAERDFYHKYFGDNCTFQESDRASGSSYKATVVSNLIVAINSTLATEAFGAGLKVLFVNPLGEDWLQPMDNIGLWYLSEPDYETFAERIDTLLNQSIEDYRNVAGSEMKRSMVYHSERPAHKIIRDRLLELTSG